MGGTRVIYAWGGGGQGTRKMGKRTGGSIHIRKVREDSMRNKGGWGG